MQKIAKKDISVVILAGGKSSRMNGIDKGLIDFRNKPMISYVFDIASKNATKVFISANRNKEKYAKYADVISDELPDFQGPLAGILTVIKLCKTPYLLVLPCDCPFINNDAVDKLINAIFNSSSEIAVAYDGQYIHSTFAIMQTNISDSLNNFLLSKKRKMSDWYEQHKLFKVDFSSDVKVLTNINNEKDLFI